MKTNLLFLLTVGIIAFSVDAFESENTVTELDETLAEMEEQEVRSK